MRPAATGGKDGGHTTMYSIRILNQENLGCASSPPWCRHIFPMYRACMSQLSACTAKKPTTAKRIAHWRPCSYLHPSRPLIWAKPCRRRPNASIPRPKQWLAPCAKGMIQPSAFHGTRVAALCQMGADISIFAHPTAARNILHVSASWHPRTPCITEPQTQWIVSRPHASPPRKSSEAATELQKDFPFNHLGYQYHLSKTNAYVNQQGRS